MQLQNFDSGAFLRDSWQKRPLVIRNAWGTWHNPLEPDELAGLACEDDVESRLIFREQDAWALEHGPFPETRLSGLGRQPCTLLVQAVDHLVPEVAALIAPFRFLPNWRIDDVMVSYANDGGGVGAHFDHYDVFLIQGLGRRRWQVGAVCDSTTELLPHDDLRLLARFEATDEWILEPGDILYVPPGMAHDGVALGDDCMTYSIGFRAPSRQELITGWSESAAEDLPDEDRYGDPGLTVQDNPGEITADALDQLHAMVAEALRDRAGFARWFGQFSSTPRYPERDWRPEDPVDIATLRELPASDAVLSRNHASRFAFIRQAGGDILLFVDGECIKCSADTAAFGERICAREQIAIGGNETEAVLGLIARLINQGSLMLETDE